MTKRFQPDPSLITRSKGIDRYNKRRADAAEFFTVSQLKAGFAQ